MAKPKTPREIREAAGLSVGRLARLADVNRKTVNRVEAGEHATTETLEALAAQLSLDAADYFSAWQLVSRVKRGAA